MPRVNIEMNTELHKKAKVISAVLGISLKEFVVKALEDEV
jgi:predicted HicB family RNase H-like nuclease